VPKRTGKYDLTFREKKLKDIKELLSAEGYIVQSEAYINNRTKLQTKCPNGHEWWAAWDNIRQGKRCRQCYLVGIEKAVATRKPIKKNKPRGQHRAEMYKKYHSALEAESYKIEIDYYINNRMKVPLICPRGHKWSASWNQFDSGKRCKQCWIEDSRHSHEEIVRELAVTGCELLSEYKGVLYRFKYRCTCGRIAYTRLKDFRNGARCPSCGGIKRKETMKRLRVKKLQEAFPEIENFQK
jgi:hypothetical protein